MKQQHLLDDMGQSECVSLSEAAKQLSVSTATVSNWLKLGLLEGVKRGKSKRVQVDSLDKLDAQIRLGEVDKLQKRANKRRITTRRVHSELHTETLSDFLFHTDALLKSCTTNELLMAIALKQLPAESKGGDELWLRDYHKIIDAHISKSKSTRNAVEKIKEKLGDLPLATDLLGKVYQHIAEQSEKAITGAFYTPESIAKATLKKVLKPGYSVFEPSCGSGIFLIEALRTKIAEGEINPLEKLYGVEFDWVAADLCRLNLLLIAKNGYSGKLNITTGDTIRLLKENKLAGVESNGFDLVVTNPPWGADWDGSLLSDSELTVLASDSYALFIAIGLKFLKRGGRLAYILPQAFLDTASHKPIREMILTNCSDIQVASLGKTFVGLITEVVELVLANQPPIKTSKVRLYSDSGEIELMQADVVRREDAPLLFKVSTKEFELVEKLTSRKHVRIGKESKFALGIVTGDNKRLLKSSPFIGGEGILRGKDIGRFVYEAPTEYIHFDVSKFQQCAKEEIFRAKEKLVYRFISDKLVVSYDDKGVLTLNSANIVIPNVGLPIKVVLGILQSDVTQFIFKARFNTLKVLRKHIESLPIFVFGESGNRAIESAVDEIIMSRGENLEHEQRLNDAIHNLLKLSRDEVRQIREFLNK